jgi:hypothetical protein
VRGAIRTIPQKYQCTAVELSADATVLYAGGLNNVVAAYDLRKGDDELAVSFALEGHQDTITGERADACACALGRAGPWFCCCCALRCAAVVLMFLRVAVRGCGYAAAAAAAALLATWVVL